jgi:hypothetical protein
MTILPDFFSSFIASITPGASASKAETATPWTSERARASRSFSTWPWSWLLFRFSSTSQPNSLAPSSIPFSTAFHQSELPLVTNRSLGVPWDGFAPEGPADGATAPEWSAVSPQPAASIAPTTATQPHCCARITAEGSLWREIGRSSSTEIAREMRGMERALTRGPDAS